VRPKVAVIYNEPLPSRYTDMGEGKAIAGVLDETAAVRRALEELEYPVCEVSLKPPLEQAWETLNDLRTDVVFNLFEGFDGRAETEAMVANILAALGLPYTGCPAYVLSLALDKVRSKSIIESMGVETPKCQVIRPGTLQSFSLTYPCIVKPVGEDASHGISEESVVNDYGALESQVKKISQLFGGKALVEEFVDGREFNVTVMGAREAVVLPVSEITYSLPSDKPKLLTFDAKWDLQSMYYRGTRAVCPAVVDDDLRSRINDMALNIYKLLGCRGYARVDMRMNQSGRVMVLEVNPNPDISPESGAARQAAAAGMSFRQFIERILIYALEGVSSDASCTVHDWSG